MSAGPVDHITWLLHALAYITYLDLHAYRFFILVHLDTSSSFHHTVFHWSMPGYMVEFLDADAGRDLGYRLSSSAGLSCFHTWFVFTYKLLYILLSLYRFRLPYLMPDFHRPSFVGCFVDAMPALLPWPFLSFSYIVSWSMPVDWIPTYILSFASFLLLYILSCRIYTSFLHTVLHFLYFCCTSFCTSCRSSIVAVIGFFCRPVEP